MRYSKVIYRDSAKPASQVVFGVVIQNDNGEITSKFAINDEKFKKIKEMNPSVDWDTFRLFDKTFHDDFIKNGFVETTESDGKKKIMTTDPKFLDYLHRTFQNNYQFTDPETIDAQKVVDLLVSMEN